MNTWLCIAAGPSLTRADCDAMRGKYTTVAINCAVFFAPWSDYWYGADDRFWGYYGPKGDWFKGQRYSITARREGIIRWRPTGWSSHGGNSGHQSVQLAVEHGAKRVLLLGYDHQHTNGKSHFHGDHPNTNRVKLGNAKNCPQWVNKMERTSLDLKKRGVEVINLSRETALECFPRSTVDEWLS